MRIGPGACRCYGVLTPLESLNPTIRMVLECVRGQRPGAYRQIITHPVKPLLDDRVLVRVSAFGKTAINAAFMGFWF